MKSIHLKTKLLNSKKYFGIGLFTMILLATFAFSSTGNKYANLVVNDFLKMLQEKYAKLIKQFPEDRVYVQFDKPFYKPGETIWFSAYVRNAENMQPSEQSDILHVELISPKGNVMTELKLIVKKGKAVGDFALSEDITGGMYKVKAYTNWQKNDETAFLFEKELQVQAVILPNLKMKLDFERKAFGAGDEVIAKLELNTNENKPLSNKDFKFNAKIDGENYLNKSATTDENGVCYIKFDLPKSLKSSDGLLNVMIDYQGQTESVSRSIPIILNIIKFALFPEGGDMVCGLNNKVAFRALNEFDKPADVEGEVYNSQGKKICNLTSFHQGMGAFELNPINGEKYYVKITKPEGVTETFSLPESLTRGYIVSTDNSNREKLVLNIQTTENEELSIVAQVRGKIYYANSIKATKGQNKLEISAADFPMGVAQITLFDSKNVERAERLVFVNKAKQLNISVTTDKEKYLPREKVKLTVSVKDDRGMPMPASLSLSVVNDQLLSFADDKSGNILSKLLLEQDIKDKVEEPAFYFDTKEAKADKALDYLLMTAGWRRFTWEKVLNNDIPTFSYLPEKTVITGTVMDSYTNKAVPNAQIVVSNSNTKISADKNGKFTINNLDLSQPVTLQPILKDFTSSPQTVNQYGEITLYMNDNKYIEDFIAPNMAMGGADEGVEMRFEAEEGQQVVKREVNNNKKGKKNRAEDKEEQVKFTPPVVVDMVEEMVELKTEADIKQENPEVKDAQQKNALDGKVVDARDRALLANSKTVEVNLNGVIYYRAKQFAAPIYNKEQKVEMRTDFRSTIYWNGNIELDRKGRTTIEFYNSDDISSFRAIVEGISTDGTVGRTQITYFTQLPFSMSAKVPIEVATEDILAIPLTLKNNTTHSISGELTVIAPDGLQATANVETSQSINANDTRIIYLNYKVLDKIGKQNFKISFKSDGLSDAFEQEIKILSKGFPVAVSFSGNEVEKEYTVKLDKVVNGSIAADFTAYPSVVSDILKGIESILGEPYGCFEQTSMTSYPNVMVMNYLKTLDKPDDKLMASASNLLDKGYKRLMTFETKEKGYEWFGGAPAHEALTAYGLMQFNDMKGIYNVDQKMIDRTAGWIMARKDGNGGFQRNPRALDNFGGASPEITNAYIVYSLAEAGYREIDKELNAAFQKATESKDPYQLALVANAAYSYKDKAKAETCMNLLYEKQAKDGSWTGLSHSVTRSTGISLTIETTSLSILAMLKSGNPKQPALDNSVKSLLAARSGSGSFGSTQGTILALKALTEYAKYSKKTNESGTIEFYVDNKKVAEKSYKAGERELITIADLNKYISTGKHTLKVKYIGCKNPLPYSVSVKWNTSLPNSQPQCVIGLDCKLASTNVKVGETVRLTAMLINKTAEGQPMTLAIIGLPAGLTAQPWQLKEMQEKKLVDYYETIGNNVVLYYRQMAPNETKTINLDLKAEISGEYDAPASSAYLYYTNEFKTWVGLPRMKVVK